MSPFPFVHYLILATNQGLLVHCGLIILMIYLFDMELLFV
jgi:hypothetical protein